MYSKGKLILLGLVLALLPGLMNAQETKTKWRLTGDLSEACSCSVPCTCNFGESPSPHHFCYFLFALDIKEGQYGSTDLSGLHLAGGAGGKGLVFYVDEKASAEQTEALKQISRQIVRKVYKAAGFKSEKDIPPDFRLLGFRRAKIEQVVGDKSSRLKIGDAGLFECKYILGLDGKTPVRVENNWSWNITGGIKGKTRVLRYKDKFGNKFSFDGTNANQGRFDWSDETPIYFR